jgi:two-component system cell cycle sensor histidine kinase PleC
MLLTALVAALGSDDEGVLALTGLSAQACLAYAAYRLHGAAVAAWRFRVRLPTREAALRRHTANSRQADLRDSDRVTAQVFATMGHELRTPLNAILGFSEVMKNEVLGSHSTPAYRDYSKHIHGSGQHLLALIDEILDLSRIESGQYTLRDETADLKQLVRESLEAVATAGGKAHAVALEAAADLDPIRVDPAAVRQAVVNLISNAIKFTPAGGRILLRVGWTSRGGQYVSVADEGPGIPPEEIGVALSSFGRGSYAVSAAEQGVGLGLPIARGLAELHGGRLLLRSQVGHGTEAVLIFPAGRCEAARAVRPAA